jgi:RNA polymerase sporulation-specific sigma factor
LSLGLLKKGTCACKNVEYNTLEDQDVVACIRAGDHHALKYLIQKYKNFVRVKARSYFLIGADHEDIVQEGMIGLFKAVRDFRCDRLTSFKAFAELCVTRQIITAIKTATRQKHVPLNSYVSLDKPCRDDSDRTLYDSLPGGWRSNPEQIYVIHEEHIDVEAKIGKVLSSLEREVLTLYLDGKSYQEIAEELSRHVKSIDNALQRVKRKLEKCLTISEDL